MAVTVGFEPISMPSVIRARLQRGQKYGESTPSCSHRGTGIRQHSVTAALPLGQHVRYRRRRVGCQQAPLIESNGIGEQALGSD
jgi:hypothetical protein